MSAWRQQLRREGGQGTPEEKRDLSDVAQQHPGVSESETSDRLEVPGWLSRKFMGLLISRL